MLVALRKQPEGDPVTENDPFPPLAAGVAEADESETDVQTNAACVMLKTAEPIVMVAVRPTLLGFASTV